METEKPNYYSILTADVRYDDRLSSTEKLLYSEITALTNKDGVCYASNNYFARLYKKTPTHISRMIKKLKDCGYINIEIEYKKNSKEIKRRNIYLLTKMLRGIDKNVNRGINKNVKDNITSINNINRIYKPKDFKTNIVNGDLEELYDN